jgi:hypothetical protein
LVDDAIDRAIGIGQRDQHAPGRRARQIAARAVDRVQHPGQPAGARDGAAFLAQDAILRAAARQNGAHPVFRQAVGHRHRIKACRQLVVGGKPRRAEMRQRRHPRHIGQLVPPWTGCPPVPLR